MEGEGTATRRIPNIMSKVNPHIFQDMTGRRFGQAGQLLVLAYAGVTHDHCRQWRIRCESCGKTKIMRARTLLRGCRDCAVGVIGGIPKG
jgi:hypothetical protein